MPFGNLPTSGGGLRAFQLYQGLKSQGVEVVASMPGFTYLAERHYAEIPAEQRETLWSFGTQDEVFARVKPDAVLFTSNWDHFDIKRKLTVPLIIDLHGSRLIETSMWDRPVSTERKVSILGQADCLLSAGTRQRLYFYGWLMQAGRVPDNEHFIRYIPISLSPDLPEHTSLTGKEEQYPYFVSGGGWFPWQNQSKAIFAACNAISSRNKGLVEIYGTPHEKLGDSEEERQIFDIYDRVKELASRSARVKVCGYIGREALIDKYTKASVALECMQYNLERELAFTTRTIEYLWCGLPVIYNNFSEISDHLREYDAGWAIDPTSDDQINRVLDEIFVNPSIVQGKSLNAARLVRDRFTWDKTIQPLIDFLENPSLAPATEPALGAIYARPSFLKARGDSVDVPLGNDVNEVRTRFVVPAENIASVEVPVAVTSEAARNQIERVELSIARPSGRVISKRSFSPGEVPTNGRLAINFPMLFQPSGGTELVFSLKLITNSTSGAPGETLLNGRGISSLSSPLTVRGVIAPTFPLIPENASKLTGKTLQGDDREALALALSFTPGDYQEVYRVKVLIKRAIEMLRKGEWRRLVRAVKRRIPGAISRIKSSLA